jgi:hypothetical protein
MKKMTSLLFLAILLLSGCSTTKVLHVWHEKDLPDTKLSNVLVIGVIKKPVYRRIFEDSMVTQLEKLGVNASASYDLFPNADYLEKSIIVSKVDQLNIDAIIFVKIVDNEKATVHVPGTTIYTEGPYASSFDRRSNWDSYYRNWHGYYNNSYQITHTPGYAVEYDVTTVETNIFSVKNEKRLWSAITKTSESSVISAINSYVDKISKRFADSPLF